MLQRKITTQIININSFELRKTTGSPDILVRSLNSILKSDHMFQLFPTIPTVATDGLGRKDLSVVMTTMAIAVEGGEKKEHRKLWFCISNSSPKKKNIMKKRNHIKKGGLNGIHATKTIFKIPTTTKTAI